MSGSTRPAPVPAVIVLPPSLDDLSFEGVFNQLAAQSLDAKLTVDGRRCAFASPYGLTALLAVAESRIERPAFLSPDNEDTAMRWVRAGFYRYAEELYDIQGSVPNPQTPSDSDSLLHVTRVAAAGMPDAIDEIQGRVSRILIDKLHLPPDETFRFAHGISEVCEDAVMRVGASGRAAWVMAQVYRYSTEMGTRHVVVIAACDAGITLRLSTQSIHRRLPCSEWNDGRAVEEVLIKGASRSGNPVVPRGLKTTRDIIGHWNGKLYVRSGTARITLVPTWDADAPSRGRVADFPGVQIQVTIPERSTSGEFAERRDGALDDCTQFGHRVTQWGAFGVSLRSANVDTGIVVACHFLPRPRDPQNGQHADVRTRHLLQVHHSCASSCGLG